MTTAQPTPYILPELDGVLAPVDPAWDLPAMRERVNQGAQLPLPEVPGTTLRVHRVPQTGLEMRCWQPTESTPELLIFAIHGGGYVMGVACLDDLRNAEMAARFNAVVVSPEYSLAPEHPFPAGADDCFEALLFATSEYPDLPLVLYGDSAGSGLVETVACFAIDAGVCIPDALICMEPAIDPTCAGEQASASMLRYADGPGWSRPKALNSWLAYLAEQDAGVLPRLADREGVPPVLTVLGQSDPLRDEGMRWALRIADTGVHSELHLLPGAVHGLLSASGTRTWQRVQGYIAEFLESAGLTADTNRHKDGC